jgi:hypothetical protein
MSYRYGSQISLDLDIIGSHVHVILDLCISHVEQDLRMRLAYLTNEPYEPADSEPYPDPFPPIEGQRAYTAGPATGP